MPATIIDHETVVPAFAAGTGDVDQPGIDTFVSFRFKRAGKLSGADGNWIGEAAVGVEKPIIAQVLDAGHTKDFSYHAGYAQIVADPGVMTAVIDL